MTGGAFCLRRVRNEVSVREDVIGGERYFHRNADACCMHSLDSLVTQR